MVIHLKPETERLVQEEIQRGHVQSVDDLIVEGVHAVRAKHRPHEQTSHQKRHTPAEAAARIRELRKGVVLSGLKISDLTHKGHKY